MIPINFMFSINVILLCENLNAEAKLQIISKITRTFWQNLGYIVFFFYLCMVKFEKTRLSMKIYNILFAAFLSFSLLPATAQKVTLGSCHTKDGGEYSGEMQSGKPQGKGKTTWKNGNTYEGEYVKGKRQGYGVYTFFDGEKYEGQWFQDQQHGQGTYYF